MTEAEWGASQDPVAMLAWLTWRGTDGPGAPCQLATARKLRLFAVACCRQVWGGAVCEDCNGRGKVNQASPYSFNCSLCHGTGRAGGLTDPRSRAAVEVAERYADGEATDDERNSALYHACAVDLDSTDPVSQLACWACARFLFARHPDADAVMQRAVSMHAPPAVQAGLLRCLFGNPFRPVTLGIPCEPGAFGNAVCLARSIYDGRRWGDLPILADALGEAGCPEEVPCPRCGGKARGVPAEGGGWTTCPACRGNRRVPNPLLAHLRSGGPHGRGCWPVDLMFGRS